MRLQGTGGDNLDALIAAFEDLVMRIVHRIADAATRLLGGTPDPVHPYAVSVDDLGVIRAQWLQHLDVEVLPALGVAFGEAASSLVGDLAAAGRDVAALSAPDAAAFLSAARNRLVGVGDRLWEAARDGLAEGLRTGEDIDELSARVRGAADVAEPRARVIARSEVVAANNAASLAQARLLDDPSVVKEWISTPDGRTRESHRLADGQRVRIGDRFHVGAAHLDFPGDPASPHQEEVVNCFPGDTRVETAGVCVGTRRWYSGEVVELTLSSGDVLTGTPNHPVLAAAGWVALGEVTEGDDLIGCALAQEPTFGDPHVDDVPTTIGEVVDALTRVRPLDRVVGRDVDFHGDGVANSEVEVVRSDRALRNGGNISGGKPLGELCLPSADLLQRRLLSEGVSSGLLRAPAAPFGRDVGGLGVGASLFRGAGRHEAAVGLDHASEGHASLFKSSTDGGAAYPVALGQGQFGHPCDVVPADGLAVDGHSAVQPRTGSGRVDPCGLESVVDGGRGNADQFGDFAEGLALSVQIHKVVKVQRRPYAAHVYNLHTESGWYIANGVIAHNCRCSIAIDLDDAPMTAAFNEGKVKRDARGKFTEKTGGGGVDAWLHDTLPLAAGTMTVGAADGNRVTLNLNDGAAHTVLSDDAARGLARELRIADDAETSREVGHGTSFADYPPNSPQGYALTFAGVTRTGTDAYEIELANGDGGRPPQGAAFTVNRVEARMLGEEIDRLSAARKVTTSRGDFAAVLERNGRITTTWPVTAGTPITLDLSPDDATRIEAAIRDGVGSIDEFPADDAGNPLLGPNDVAGRTTVKLPGTDLTVTAYGRYGTPSGRFEFESSAHDWVLQLSDVEAERIGLDGLADPVAVAEPMVAAAEAIPIRTGGVTLAVSGVDVDQWDDGTFTVGWWGGQHEARLTDTEADQVVDAVNEVRAVAAGEKAEASVDTAHGETVTLSRGDGDDVILGIGGGTDPATVTLPDGDAYDLSYQLALWLDRGGYYGQHPADAQPLTAARRPWNPDQHPRDPLTGRFIGKGLVPRKSGGAAKSGAIPKPPGPAAPTAGTSAAAEPAAHLKAAVDSGVKSRKPLSSGATGEVELVTFNDGTRAIHKTSHAQDDTDAKREVDAAELAAATAQALGVDTPAIVRINDRETYMDYISSPTAYNDPTMDEQAIADLAASPAGRRLGLFDLLIDYDDRSNRDNWALHDGKIVALDHDTAWEAGRDPKKPPQEKWALSPFTTHFVAGKKWKPNDLSAAEVADIRARLDGLQPEFERLGRAKWLIFARARLAAIAAYGPAGGTGPTTASFDRRGGYVMADPTPPDAPAQPDPVAAAAAGHTGAMVALIPTDADAQRLAVDGGEPVDELHCTLMYLGEAADIPDDARTAITDAVRSYVDGWPPVQAEAFAVSMFNPPGMDDSDGKQRESCVVLGLSGEDLDMVHDMVTEAVNEVAVGPAGFTLPEQHAPWIPHTTLVYSEDPGQVASLVDRVGPVTFDRVRVVFGDDATDIPLNAPQPDAVVPDDGEPASEATTAAAAGELQSHMPAHLQRYWLRRLAPWGHGSFKRCVRALRKHYPKDPEGACANLHKEATGRWPGAGHHADDGGTTMADMPTPEPTAPAPAAPDGCPEGQHRDPDSGDCVPDEDTPTGPVEHFHAIMHVEGVSTGMRTFEPGSLTWREPPFAFHWQRGSSAHSGTPETVQVGNVTRAERDGDTIHGWGPLDLGCAEGLDYARRLVEGFARWVSIGLDESLKESDIEYVWPNGETAEGEGVEMLFAEPEEMIFHAGRIAELSGVSIPAQAEAVIEPTQALIDALAEMGVLVASAVGAHDTATSDGAWDAATAEGNLPSPMPLATARGVYAWIDDSKVDGDQVVKDGCKFPHHEIGADGEPGAANTAACSAGVGALHGGRGGTTIPDADRKGTYDHLAKHLADAGQEPPPFEDGPIVAAGHIIEIPDCPPAWWFNEPVDVTPHGALTITDEGRIYGYLAPAGVAHRAFPDRRVTAPMGRVDYDRWMGGEAIVAGGGRVVAGPITMECGHMPPAAADRSDVRMQHYDNACSVVAKARVGENRHGVWIAGALEPGVSADQVSRMMACRLSGDWAPHPERAGWREFCAALLVPVPGFPMARSAPSVRVAEGALVASAVPVRVVHADADVVAVDAADLRPVLERVARSIGRDASTRLQALRNRVHANN